MKLRLSVVIASLCWLSQSAWAQQFCWTGSAQVDCGSPTAYLCIDLIYAEGGSPFCTAQGYPFWIDSGRDGEYCADPDCLTVPAAVPELEEYAAMLFLSLALLVGWKCRRTFNLSATA